MGNVSDLYKHAKAKDYALILDNVAKGFVALLVPVETRLEEYQYRHPDLYGAQTRTRIVPDTDGKHRWHVYDVNGYDCDLPEPLLSFASETSERQIRDCVHWFVAGRAMGHREGRNERYREIEDAVQTLRGLGIGTALMPAFDEA
ncbi:hypothetical protein SAMN05216338_1001851 [Bradyrhizobium sp. Rc2d]|uniref:hypothetical protein n=1 Tax=Bradyrhizobium sp. Rc2d TaxID=1855321 RepID=UPI00088D90B5|nr:hypothetical protein [Bradyrhizobium sp. Rc2d]SDG59602.1 hypothetical protein SAMN05216338_1001851 [Bradyrhizobium sp. Rc2d]